MPAVILRRVAATLLVLAVLVWAEFHLAADHWHSSWFTAPIWIGFVLAVPVIWIRKYTVRLRWCLALPLAAYLLMMGLFNPHPGFPKRLDIAVLFLFGGISAAQVRSVWEAARNYLKGGATRRAEDPGKNA